MNEIVKTFFLLLLFYIYWAVYSKCINHRNLILWGVNWRKCWENLKISKNFCSNKMSYFKCSHEKNKRNGLIFSIISESRVKYSRWLGGCVEFYFGDFKTWLFCQVSCFYTCLNSVLDELLALAFDAVIYQPCNMFKLAIALRDICVEFQIIREGWLNMNQLPFPDQFFSFNFT